MKVPLVTIRFKIFDSIKLLQLDSAFMTALAENDNFLSSHHTTSRFFKSSLNKRGKKVKMSGWGEI